ncbi:MAG: hypothetical protein JRG89_10300 [Deltaproteobacteria bacterium]|nr:hypothetical protein [Deltaproteobacteria bacterium]MBW2388816.1 hypothetical protein [Deltaproteobacteria bacterium]
MAKSKKSKKKKSGGGGFLLLVILVLAGGAGGWNYQRNLSLEANQKAEGSRPFQGYSDTALVDLAEAYGEQSDILDRKYQASLERRTGVRDTDGLIMERVEEFERVQKIGESIRVATSKAADSQARLRQIRDEQAWRRNQGEWKLHLQRLTSI